MASKRKIQKHIANTLMGLSHPRRVHLFQIINDSQNPPNYKTLRAKTGYSPQVLSHHLTMMMNAKLIQKQRKGSHSLYRAAPENIYNALTGLTPSKSTHLVSVSSSPRSYLDS